MEKKTQTNWTMIAIAALVLLVAGVTGWKTHLLGRPQASSPQPESTGESPKAASPANAIPSCITGSATNPGHHAVTLSWDAGVPRSNAASDAVKGYDVYRSSSSSAYSKSDKMNSEALPGTRCIDSSVEAGKTYYYSVKTITQNGGASGFSKEIKAVVPTP